MKQSQGNHGATQTMCSILGDNKIEAAASDRLSLFILTSESQHSGLRCWKPEL